VENVSKWTQSSPNELYRAGRRELSAGARLREMLRRAGMSYDDFARAIGKRRGSSVQRYLDPDRDDIPLNLIEPIASALVGRGRPAITREEIFSLTNLRLDTSRVQKTPSRSEIGVATQLRSIYIDRDLPVCGQPSGRDDEMVFGNVLSLVPRPADLLSVRDAYAVYCHADTMQPRYRPGEMLYIDPIRPVAPGDDVIVQFTDGTGFIRELVAQTPRTLTCRQHNPPREHVYPIASVRSVHLVIMASRIRV
jgi:phage repressor protein C with HTH and peptisase S24 domain